MISKFSLEQEIAQLENAPETFKKYERLAALKFVYNCYYADSLGKAVESPAPRNADIVHDIVHLESDSAFAKAADGKETSKVLNLVDELVTTLQALHPPLYNGFLSSLKEI